MELTNFTASVTSLKNTALLLGLLFLQLINVTIPATIPSSQESPNSILIAAATVLSSQGSTNENLFATSTVPLSQESSNDNSSPAATIPSSEESFNHTAASISPSQESLSHNVIVAATAPLSQESPNDNLLAIAAISPVQESSNDNLPAAAPISTTQVSSNDNLLAAAPISPSQVSVNDQLPAAAPISPAQQSSSDNLLAAAPISTLQESSSDNLLAAAPISTLPESSNLPAAVPILPSQESPNDNLLATVPISPSQESSTDNLLATTPILSSQKSPNYNLFAADLFSVMVSGKANQNIVYSPASIQTCLALTFIGAEGDTAEEIRNVLRLGDGDKVQVAENFKEFLQTSPHNATTSDIIDVPELKIASRLYVNEQLNVSAEFNTIAQEYFGTQAEQVNFTDNKAVVKKINSWIEEKTESKIKDLIHEAALNGDTNAVLVNAIYFKAKWLNPFSLSSTSNSKFRLNLKDSLDAEIMYNEEFFGYANLPELEATALEMPYENGDISMLIILPNEIEGLQKLEQKLKAMDLNEITAKMTIRKVLVYVPKFRIEFDVDLKEPLENLGLTTTFSPSANFKGLFSSPQVQSLTEVKHKAFLDVNEAGSEAAAATFTTLTTLSAIFDEPIFRADHPFVFAILSKSAVYFAGHVATI